MQGQLVWLFPPWWRRRHGAAYRELLEQTPASSASVLGVVGAAARAWGDPRHSRLTFPTAAVLMMASLALLFGFFGGWSTISRQGSFDVEWRVVQATTAGYAALGLFLARRGHRVVGSLTTGMAVLAFLCQMSLLVPGWRTTDVPIRAAAMWFMGLACWSGWWGRHTGCTIRVAALTRPADVARAWSDRPALPASEGDWLLPYLRGFGTVGGVVGAQWPRYAALPPTADQASDGELDPTLAATLREVLGRHTDEPGDCVAALWEGWGLVTGGMSMSWLGPGRWDAPVVRMGPTLPVDVVNAPRFGPPYRDYLLFGVTLEELGPAPVATTDNWAGSHGPSLFWPRSQQWCLGVEIDVVVTLVGGSAALVGDLLALPGAVEVDSVERLRREWFAEGFPLAEDY